MELIFNELKNINIKKSEVQVKKKTLIIFLFFIVVSNVYAQKKITKEQFLKDSTYIMRPRIARPQIRIDNRLTFFKKQTLGINGFDAGLLLKEKLRFTLGYYKVAERLTSFEKVFDGLNYDADYKLNYGALNLEFIYKNTRFVSLGLPVEFGFGNNSLKYSSKQNSIQPINKSGFTAISYFGLSGTFKPIRWIGLKAAIGYRKTIVNEVKEISFDGLYTSIGLAIDFREIIRDCRMYKLQRKYRKNSSAIGTAVDLITD